MDHRLLFAAVLVKIYAALWPAIFLFLGSYTDWFYWLVVFPGALIVTSSLLSGFGIVSKGKVTLDWLIVLAVLSLMVFFSTLISLFFYYGLYNYGAEGCPPIIVSYKCTIVQAANYVDLYMLLTLLVSAATFFPALRSYLKPNTSHF